MAISEADLIWIRTKVGDTPSDDDVEEIWDRTLDRAVTAREILERRRANFAAGPAQFSVPGEYSQSVDANLRELDRLLGDPELATESSGSLVNIIGPPARRPR